MIHTRIQKLLQYYDLTASKLADEIGVQRSSISHIISGRNKPSLDFIQKLMKVYPGLNSGWLINGKGEMISGKSDKVVSSELFSVDHEKEDLKETIRNLNKKLQQKSQALNEKQDFQKNTNAISQPQKHIKETEKRLSKIVMFYEDGTFKEYLPG